MTEKASLQSAGERAVKKRKLLKVAIWAFILFIGIGGAGVWKYKKGADQAKCILQMATVQKLIISYACLNGQNTGHPAETADLIKDKYIGEFPICPAGGNYEELGAVPRSVEQFLKCDHEGHTLGLDDY